VNIPLVVREIQAKLGVEVDGKIGPETLAAIHAKICGKSATLPANQDAVDDRSEVAIRRLLPQVQPYARALVHAAKAQGIVIVVTSGLRTYDEQNALYAQGRTKPGKKVTNAAAGQSVHNYGFAVDIVLIIDGKTASWDVKSDWDGDKVADWDECVRVFAKYGWSWGGNWTSFKDMPHFEKIGRNNWRTLKKLPKGLDGYVKI